METETETAPEMTLQMTIDCGDPQRMVAFWSEALGYVPEPPPEGHASWRAYWEDMGVPEEELPPGAGDLPESIIDPTGRGPRVWFQKVPETKAVKNRWHFDLKVGGGRAVPLEVRKQRVDATVARLGGAGATVAEVRELPDMDFYATAMLDPEGNEFDVV
ncbi:MULTISPECIES: VOC family protein [unclassified Streptomyces]|uniref:VOC family protein n=1 Tax=unclassified Streptomyces TaxID=2593676 RepID=UPI002FDC038C